MRVLLPDPPPAAFEELIERRRRLGQDVLDEMWEGVLHMHPAPHGRRASVHQQLAVLLDRPAREAGLLPRVGIFNLGGPDNYRVPDGGLLGPGPDELYYKTAAMVIEIVSPGDESWEKLPFYAAHGVDEVLIVDPDARRVHWLARDDASRAFVAVERSRLIDLGADELAARIDWPAA